MSESIKENNPAEMRAVKKTETIKIAIIAEGEVSLATIMAVSALRIKALRGCALTVINGNKYTLKSTQAAVQRLKKTLGNIISIEADTDVARGIKDADFVLLSGENGRAINFKDDYQIPRKYGSKQLMGSSGGPGSIFHSLRNIKYVLEVCNLIEEHAPYAFLVNMTYPMSSVMLAINKATKVKSVGMSNDFQRGVFRLSSLLMMPPSRIDANAFGINHLSWFYEINDSKTGKSLYWKLKRHLERYPFLHEPLARSSFKEYQQYPVGPDIHIGEFLPSEKDVSNPIIPLYRFFQNGGNLKNMLIDGYVKGYIPMPLNAMPGVLWHEVMPLIGAMASGVDARIKSVNVPNKGCISNLPDEMIVEIPVDVKMGELVWPEVPPMNNALAEIMLKHFKTQSLVVDAVLRRNPDLALKAIDEEPFSPADKVQRHKMFDEMLVRQKEYLPF